MTHSIYIQNPRFEGSRDKRRHLLRPGRETMNNAQNFFCILFKKFSFILHDITGNYCPSDSHVISSFFTVYFLFKSNNGKWMVISSFSLLIL